MDVRFSLHPPPPSLLLIVCNHPAKFCGHSHCDSGNTTYLICYLIFQDYVLKGLVTFWKKTPYCM